MIQKIKVLKIYPRAFNCISQYDHLTKSGRCIIYSNLDKVDMLGSGNTAKNAWANALSNIPKEKREIVEFDRNEFIEGLKNKTIQELVDLRDQQKMVMDLCLEEYRNRHDYVTCHIDPSDLGNLKKLLKEKMTEGCNVSWGGDHRCVGTTTIRVAKDLGSKVTATIKKSRLSYGLT